MANTIDTYSTRSMLEKIEIIKEPTTFLRDTFFPTENLHTTRNIDLDVVIGGRVVAQYVERGQSGEVFSRKTFSTKNFEPPYLSPERVLKPKDLQKRFPNSPIYQNNQNLRDQAARLRNEDFQFLNDAIVRSEELQASQAIFSGGLQLKYKDKSATIDLTFGRDASHDITLSGTDLWDNAASDPIGDLEDWADLLAKKGYIAKNVLMGSDAYKSFLNNTKVQALLDNRSIKIGSIESDKIGEASRVARDIGTMGLDIWIYRGYYKDPSSGIVTPYIPAKKVAMIGDMARFSKNYAIVDVMEALESNGGVYRRFPRSYLTKKPESRVIEIHSAPLLLTDDVDAVVSASVLA